MKNILLIMGGGSTEHDISIMSAEYIKTQIDHSKFRLVLVEIGKDFKWRLDGDLCELSFEKLLKTADNQIEIHAAIPCIHGYPGETGDIQSFFELIELPYFGCNSETSVLCFNKLMTKLMLEVHGLKTAPFMQVNSLADLIAAQAFFNEHKSVYVKATNQGSSVGCYRVDKSSELEDIIKEASRFSPYVIIEKEIKGRELEVSAFEYDGRTHTTKPGEIDCPNEFYTYEAKYNKDSLTKTIIEAQDIDEDKLDEIHRQAGIAFSALKLRHLSRIDFFLTTNGEVLINEVNTFPGHTSISMFPMMMEKYGIKYSEFINQHLSTLVQN
jgi:D-alanine-D-alanine ligase